MAGAGEAGNNSTKQKSQFRGTRRRQTVRSLDVSSLGLVAAMPAIAEATRSTGPRLESAFPSAVESSRFDRVSDLGENAGW